MGPTVGPPPAPRSTGSLSPGSDISGEERPQRLRQRPQVGGAEPPAAEHLRPRRLAPRDMPQLVEGESVIRRHLHLPCRDLREDFRRPRDEPGRDVRGEHPPRRPVVDDPRQFSHEPASSSHPATSRVTVAFALLTHTSADWPSSGIVAAIPLWSVAVPPSPTASRAKSAPVPHVRGASDPV